MVGVKRKQSAGKGTVESAIPGIRLLGIKVRRPSELVGQVKVGFRFEHLVQLEKQSGLTRGPPRSERGRPPGVELFARSWPSAVRRNCDRKEAADRL